MHCCLFNHSSTFIRTTARYDQCLHVVRSISAEANTATIEIDILTVKNPRSCGDFLVLLLLNSPKYAYTTIYTKLLPIPLVINIIRLYTAIDT